MKDIFGQALIDYQQGNYTEDLITETSISDPDVLPVPYLFRSYDEMPILEQRALDLCYGRILDVGCGAGSHSLVLQQNGLLVDAVDISEGAIVVAQKRGLEGARRVDVFQLKDKRYDTILLLMNGSGLFQHLNEVPHKLNLLAELLNPGGQILVDSTDIRYMFDTLPDGRPDIPTDHYFGEVDYWVSYKGETDDPFPMLYIDPQTFKDQCRKSGLHFEVIFEGNDYDYLARISNA